MDMQSTARSFLSAAEAAAYLEVTPATLYSYVSRGLVRSEPAQPGTRSRRYRLAELEQLRKRREQRLNPASVAASVLDFGEPLLTSTLCLIEGGELYYRGRSATELAQQTPFEAVAWLLWTGQLADPPHAPLSPPWLPLLGQAQHKAHPVDALLGLLVQLNSADPAARDTSPANTQRIGRQTLHLLMVLAGGPIDSPGLAHGLAHAWQVAPPQIPLLNAALVLLADHELNISSFTARCVASSDASTYLALTAAIAALQGPRHGGQSLQCEAFLRETQWDGDQAVAQRLRRGDPIPGFGHTLYPQGDPRARHLLGAIYAAFPDAPTTATLQTTTTAAAQAVGCLPNVDFALAALVHSLNLPSGASLVLFCLGRLAGWIGHILEQQATGQLIRPRARYIGPPPNRAPHP
jgi:citrate synthase